MVDGGSLTFLALLAGMRRIFLRDFALACSIGIHPFERAARQRILVNVDIFVDGGPCNRRPYRGRPRL